MDTTLKYESTVDIRMEEYITEAIQAFEEDAITSLNTSVMRTLFEVNDVSKLLGDKKHGIYHHILEKLLHVAKICRLKIQLAVRFLCTIVSCSTDHDWGKLRRYLKYLKGIET